MASDLDDLADPERRLCEVLAAYFEAVKAGEAPERATWLGRHPDLADQLAAFLDEQDRLLRMTEPLRTIAEAAAGPDPGDAAAAGRDIGDYELLGEIARGGMGVVYRARQRGLNRLVALKMLRSGSLADGDDAPPVPPGGRGGRPARSPEHRADLRGGRARRLELLRDEADRRGQPGPSAARAGRRSAGGRAAGGDRRAGRPPRPPARRVAPRPEALEHPDRRRGPAARHRLRPGQAGARATPS